MFRLVVTVILLQTLSGADFAAENGATDFNVLFPGFVESTSRLHDAFIPISMGILVLSFALVFSESHSDPMFVFRFIIKLFLIVLLVTHLDEALNSFQAYIDDFVETNVPARPDNIAEV